jgi:preprotein translocase subunit SecF
MVDKEDGRREPARFFELIPPNLGINFVGVRLRMMAVSWVIVLVGLASVFVKGGLNYGIDFAGGTMMHVRLATATRIGEVRAALRRPDVRGVVVQNVGHERNEFQIRALAREDGQEAAVGDVIRDGLQTAFGAEKLEVLRVETVGPKVSRDLWRNAALAVLAATLMMAIYIAVRFDLRFAVGAAVALLHDVGMTVGMLSVADMEFDLTTVAALLTVVGYSVNDTVIISDRIRENMRKMRREALPVIVNLSINETLSRTLITSSTAMLVTAALFMLGGSVIHSFAFTLLVGFIVGTYSSIFVASPIVLYLERRGAGRGR